MLRKDKKANDVPTYSETLKRSLALLTRKGYVKIFIMLLLMVVIAVLYNLPPVILGTLTDRLLSKQITRLGDAWFLLSVILLASVFAEILTVYRRYLLESLATSLEKNIRLKATERLLLAPQQYYRENLLGEIVGRLARCTDAASKLIKLTFMDAIPAIVTGLVAVLIAFYKAPHLIAFIMMLVVPFSVWISTQQVKSQNGIRVALFHDKTSLDAKTVDILRGLETVRVMHTEDIELNAIELKSEQIRAKEITHHVSMAKYDALKFINEAIFYTTVIGLSIYYTSKGLLSIGDILVVSMLFQSIVKPLKEVHRIIDEASEAKLLANEIYQIIEMPIDDAFLPIVDSLKNKQTDAVVKPQYGNTSVIEIIDLCFRYAHTNHGPLLCDVNVMIGCAEHAGFVGSSGCGKSTLFKLILRLEHGIKGIIFFNGRSIEYLSRQEIAEKIMYISQNPFIKSGGTISENISYGMPVGSFCEEDVQKAAQKACLHDEILQLPDGYSTVVSDGGSNLSGGQKQRLNIARIFLREPPDLLMLDEATSALDMLTEASVIENIESYMKGRAMVSIAHRLSTLQNCDRIFVMDHGTVVEFGSYDELILRKGVFAQMVATEKHKKSILTAVG